MFMRFIKYSIGGLAGFLLDMLLVNVFIYYGISYNISIVLGFIIAAWVFSYFFHRHVTFEAQQDGEHSEHFSKFSVVTTLVFILDVGMALFFANTLIKAYQSSPPFLLVFVHHVQTILHVVSLPISDSVILVNSGKILGAMIGGVGHYILLHFWVFKKKAVNKKSVVVEKKSIAIEKKSGHDEKKYLKQNVKNQKNIEKGMISA